MDQQITARATVSTSRRGTESSSLGIGNPTAAYAQSESTSSQRIDVTVLLASSSVACHDDKCLNDTRGHAAIDEIAEDFASPDRRDQASNVDRERRPAARLRLPSPKQPEPLAMPPNEGVGSHDREHGPPVDQPGEQDQRDADRIVGPTRPDAALSVERQLLPEEEILRRQL